MATTRKQMFLEKINDSNFSTPVPVTVEEQILDGMSGGGSSTNDFFIVNCSNQVHADLSNYFDEPKSYDDLYVYDIDKTEEEITSAITESKLVLFKYCGPDAMSGTNLESSIVNSVEEMLTCGSYLGVRGSTSFTNFFQSGESTYTILSGMKGCYTSTPFLNLVDNQEAVTPDHLYLYYSTASSMELTAPIG